MRRYLLLSVWLLLLPGAVFAAPRPILVLGDSLSAAYHIDPKSGWVALLDTRLKQNTDYVEWSVVNASISGETSAGGLARLPALLAQNHPALVLVELGANDALRGLSLDELRANLDKIVSLSRDAGAQVVLIGIEIPVNYGTRYRDGLRTLYRDVSVQFKLPLLPFLLDGVAQDAQLMQDDGLHPRAEAEARVLENVWAVLEPVLQKPAQK